MIVVRLSLRHEKHRMTADLAHRSVRRKSRADSYEISWPHQYVVGADAATRQKELPAVRTVRDTTYRLTRNSA